MSNGAKMIAYKITTGEIKTITGLHIGGSSDTIEIGGNDNPIIRDPISNEPYIPGSSLKGKMRSLLEWKLNRIDPGGNVHGFEKKTPCTDQNCPICRIFGTANKDAKLGPTRLIVRDAHLSAESRRRIKVEGEILSENKYENSINRITAIANPRPLERVVPNVTFSFEMIYRMFDLDNGMKKSDEELFENVLLGLKLVEMDGLGGAISRGCGKIEFGHTDDDGWHPGEVLVNGVPTLLPEINA